MGFELCTVVRFYLEEFLTSSPALLLLLPSRLALPACLLAWGVWWVGGRVAALCSLVSVVLGHHDLLLELPESQRPDALVAQGQHLNGFLTSHFAAFSCK